MDVKCDNTVTKLYFITINMTINHHHHHHHHCHLEWVTLPQKLYHFSVCCHNYQYCVCLLSPYSLLYTPSLCLFTQSFLFIHHIMVHISPKTHLCESHLPNFTNYCSANYIFRSFLMSLILVLFFLVHFSRLHINFSSAAWNQLALLPHPTLRHCCSREVACE